MTILVRLEDESLNRIGKCWLEASKKEKEKFEYA